jgi:rare lipoprotein A
MNTWRIVIAMVGCLCFDGASIAQVGKASWYASGGKTASGERFRPDDPTCAHRSFPFGSRLRITDLSTGRSVVCTVNDRGPFVRGRIVDLSRGAARLLGIIEPGSATVSVEYDAGFIDEPSPLVPSWITTTALLWRAGSFIGEQTIAGLKAVLGAVLGPRWRGDIAVFIVQRQRQGVRGQPDVRASYSLGTLDNRLRDSMVRSYRVQSPVSTSGRRSAHKLRPRSPFPFRVFALFRPPRIWRR